MQAGIESITRQKLNSEQINYLRGQLAIGWANVAIGEKSVSNEADRIANELMMGMKDLDRKDRELIKDCKRNLLCHRTENLQKENTRDKYC